MGGSGGGEGWGGFVQWFIPTVMWTDSDFKFSSQDFFCVFPLVCFQRQDIDLSPFSK